MKTASKKLAKKESPKTQAWDYKGVWAPHVSLDPRGLTAAERLGAKLHLLDALMLTQNGESKKVAKSIMDDLGIK